MAKNKEKQSASPERITIVEGHTVDICGWHVSLSSIWIDNDSIKADLAMWSDKLRKPLSGGYPKGSEVKIGTTNCTYYVHEIKKFGKNSEKPGYIVLSTQKLETLTTKKCQETESIEATTRARIGDVDFGLGLVYKEKSGKMAAAICPPLNSPLGEDFDVYEGDTLWVGECAYKVEKIAEGYRKPDGRYENGYIVLKKHKKLLTDKGPTILGQWISQPPTAPKDVP
ncbi:MAG: hypothetical protein KIH08_04000 [Candidatus Freyarchaeota archaeon]|nr:hypothetical protein [Candidatus Jordarchaeia archaeon]MBS7267686.1 hypothetical protein [Candidatus Jordarchaeia archaeon]MBS7278846.1 hypothetical protein [Candidatus Jordarchaeia archaeon]